MEQARQKPHDAASNELDDILREAHESRRRPAREPSGTAGGGDDPVADPKTQLKLVPGLTPAARAGVPAPQREIKFEAEEFHLAEPSDTRPRPIFVVTPSMYVALVLGVLVAFLWLRLPAGLPLVPEPQLPAAYTDASIRWGLLLTSQRVDDFYRQNGRMPWGFQEIGAWGSDLISYERVSDDRYRLTAPGANGPLTLDSERSRAEFLGNSLDALRSVSEAKP
jgi:hypothetical protein